MILTCPSCATRYYADDASIGPQGRSVRCAACANTWFAEPQLTLDSLSGGYATGGERQMLTRERVERLRRAAAQGVGPAPSAAARFRAQQAERMRKDRVRATVYAWGGAVAALAATTTTAVAFRQDLAVAWPQSAWAFEKVGLGVNTYGLEFEALKVERSFDGPTPVLVVQGEVSNVTLEDKAVPALRISVRDAAGAEVYFWLVSLGDSVAPAGGTLPFEARLENPPSDSAELEVQFASAAQAREALAGQIGHSPASAPPPADAAPTPAGSDSAPDRAEPLVLGPDAIVPPAGGPADQISFYEPAAGPGGAHTLDGLAPRLSAEAANALEAPG